MNKSQIPQGMYNNIQVNGWQVHQIIPTDRYFILFRVENGADYVMADAIILLYRMVENSVQFKTTGLNFGMANYYDDCCFEETEENMIYDVLELVDFEDMIRYKMTFNKYSREEAIRAIKSDFQKTKVGIDYKVQMIFDGID